MKNAYAHTFLISALLLLTSACAQETQWEQVYVPGPTVVVPAPVQPLTEIERIVADENEYRLGLGQTALTPGLSCTLYSITGGDRIQASIAGHNTLQGVTQRATFLLKDVINQPNTPISEGNSVLPQALRVLYKNMYLLRCQGQIVVTESAHYTFELTSDDASLLYVDGSKLLDNDNAHGVTNVAGTKYLRRGVHTIRLDYVQSGAGHQALILMANGGLIDPAHYVH
jgi:PA14 domain